MWPRRRAQRFRRGCPSSWKLLPSFLKRKGPHWQLQRSCFCRKTIKAHFAVLGWACQDNEHFTFWKSLLLLLGSWGLFFVETTFQVRTHLGGESHCSVILTSSSSHKRQEKSNALVGFRRDVPSLLIDAYAKGEGAYLIWEIMHCLYRVYDRCTVGKKRCMEGWSQVSILSRWIIWKGFGSWWVSGEVITFAGRMLTQVTFT